MQNNELILNLGVGSLPILATVGVDCNPDNFFCDELADLNNMPWEWDDNSIDGIYMFHTLEHFEHPLEIIKECHRILKPGGFLFIVVPHSSLVNAIGCIAHYRTFSYNTFNDYLDNQMKLFKTEIQRLWYLDFDRKNNPYGIKFTNTKKRPYGPILLLLAAIIQPLIDLSPRVFERFWHGWVGGAHEVVWEGVKI
jgi:SAM-dependent methyltransferase